MGGSAAWPHTGVSEQPGVGGPLRLTFPAAEGMLGPQAKPLLTVFLLYVQVFLRTQNFSGQRAMFPTSAVPGRFLCEEQMSGPCCLGMKNLSPCYRQTEGTMALCALREGWTRWAPSLTVLRSAETL